MKILVADDDPSTRKMLCLQLRRWGFDPIECTNGHDAWEALQSPTRPYMAILDWNMPGRNGPEICQLVRKQGESLDYIYLFLLTARHDKKDIIEGLQSGADDYITKPFDPNELRTRIKTAQRILDLQAEFRREISRRKSAERELADLILNLEDRVKERTERIQQLLEQKNRFVNQLGHDLKTPLTPLLALLPVLKEQALSEADIEVFDLLIENVDYMTELVGKTVQLARLSAPQFSLKNEHFELVPFLRSILDSLAIGARKKNITLMRKNDIETLIYGDKLRIREVLENILSNGIKYTPPGGCIEFQTILDEDRIVIEVSDTGLGLTQEQLTLVFDEFYKADPSRTDRSSSGLGLSICKQIMDMHGGEIHISSPGLGKGTTVRLTFLGKGETYDETHPVN